MLRKDCKYVGVLHMYKKILTMKAKIQSIPYIPCGSFQLQLNGVYAKLVFIVIIIMC